MSNPSDQYSTIITYQMEKIKDLEQEVKTERNKQEYAREALKTREHDVREAYSKVRALSKELAQTKKAIRMLILTISLENEQEKEER